MEMNDNKNVDPQLGINRDEDIEWDNGEATYGHKRADFKRKDQPDEAHLTKTANDPNHHINEELKNANLSQNEDIGNRNKERDKGVSGKDL
ncbi:hypothetical protein [Pedobacter psychrodurus]|uniref:hypothetical protein n=1 Tax=Pedobacter psychrodurus TaxID=2530456 RepID=UPI00293092BE|nr:hypothetical protein [Pedobacter psychrodurus]